MKDIDFFFALRDRSASKIYCRTVAGHYVVGGVFQPDAWPTIAGWEPLVSSKTPSKTQYWLGRQTTTNQFPNNIGIARGTHTLCGDASGS